MNQPMNPNKQMVALTPEEAQLLKAAPRMYELLKELYEACKLIVEVLGSGPFTSQRHLALYHKAEELIAKVDKGD